MKTMEEIVTFIVSSHSEAAKKNDHVILIFADGEVSFTKGGDLLFQRTMHHQETVPLESTSWGRNLKKALEMSMREKYNGHSLIFCDDETATKVVKIMKDWAAGEMLTPDDLTMLANENVMIGKQIMELRDLSDKLARRFEVLRQDYIRERIKVSQDSHGYRIGSLVRMQVTDYSQRTATGWGSKTFEGRVVKCRWEHGHVQVQLETTPDSWHDADCIAKVVD